MSVSWLPALALGGALALAACGSDPPVGGDVDLGPGAVVDADSIAVSPDGTRLAAGCGSQLCVWNTADGALAATYNGGSVVAWSPRGDLIATSGVADARATVVLLDAAGGTVVRTLVGHDVANAQDAVGVGVTDLAFSPDGSTLASSGHDGSVRLWSVSDGSEVATLETAGDDPDALAFSPDGHLLAVAAPESAVEVWSLDSRSKVGTLGSEPQGDVVWRPDGGVLVTATRAPGAGAGVHSWDPATLLENDDPIQVAAYRLAFSPDGASLAMTVKGDPTVVVESPGGTPARLTGHTDQPRAVAWSPDGRTVYTASSQDGILASVVAGGQGVAFEKLGG